MEENNHSILQEDHNKMTPLSEHHQEVIHLLNEDTESNSIADDHIIFSNSTSENAYFIERYKSIEGIEILAEDEQIKHLLMQFDPESIKKLQLIGISLPEYLYNGTLLSLSSLLPAKVGIQPVGLSQPLTLLITPQLTQEGNIHLIFLPYAKYIPAIPLNLKQQEAVKQNTPFLLVKRVTEATSSPIFEQKQGDLWDTLTLAVAIGKKPFKELLEVIKYQPLGVENWVQNQFWTNVQAEKAVNIINSIFPLQVGFFTGLHLLFYPFDCLHQLPHLQAAIQARLLEQ